jgi:hypothetical protein
VKKVLLTIFVIFALFSLTLMLVPEVRSQTQSVKIVSYTYYIDSLGYLVVVGEVQNDGPNTIASVVVTGVVSSTDGSQSSSYAQVWGQNLLPQQKAPFYMEFTSESNNGAWNSDISNVELNVYSADPTAEYQYQGLEITSQQSYLGTNKVGTLADFGVFWVTGTIQNTGSQTAENVSVIATFYNSQKEVVAVGYSDKTTMNPYSISPQQSSTFKLGAFDLNQSIVPSDKKIVTYSLLLQMQGPILEGSSPVTVPTLPPTASPPPISSYTPIPTNTSGNPSDANSSGTPISPAVYIIVGIAIAIIVIAGLILLRKPSKPKPISSDTKTSTSKNKKRKR